MNSFHSYFHLSIHGFLLIIKPGIRDAGKAAKNGLFYAMFHHTMLML